MIFYKGKSIFVSGAAGTIGSALIERLLACQPAEIRMIDTNESEIFFIDKFAAVYENHPTQLHAYVGDVRDSDKLVRKLEGVDIVFHVAALKHVILCERSPFDAVQTNIIGVKNMIDAALANRVERVLLTSSDKAVNPTNVMGTSKLMGERLMTAANSLKRVQRTIFSSTRFGNVLGSRGSVVPIFARQIRQGGPITITNEGMTRFVMTVEQSVEFVLQAAAMAQGGEVFVSKMPVIRIVDLAKAMIRLLAPRYGYAEEEIVFEIIGAKQGEKLYEELMTKEEAARAIELKDMFVVTPAFKSVYEDISYDYPDVVSDSVGNSYVSMFEPAMSVDAIVAYLGSHKILDQLDAPPFYE